MLDATAPALIGQALTYPHWDMLRLSGNHHGFPVAIRRLGEDHSLCVNLFRQCCACAYVVNRRAARRICERLLPMKLPYDHAFDREWLLGFSALQLHPFVARQRGYDSQISSLGFEKFPLPLRLPAFLYRLANEVTRFCYRLVRCAAHSFK